MHKKQKRQQLVYLLTYYAEVTVGAINFVRTCVRVCTWILMYMYFSCIECGYILNINFLYTVAVPPDVYVVRECKQMQTVG